jgi:phage terminase large subunit-like protein
VRAAGTQLFYDMHVPGPQNYAAEGFWNHNTGKTDACARYIVEHVEGPSCDTRIRGGHRIGIIAPTIGDAVESCVEGPSGLKAHDPRVQLRSGVGGHYVKFPNGAVGKLFGAHTPDDIERLRSGGNRCIFWLEELAAQRQLEQALHHSSFGLRIGSRPHYVGSTTPKPRRELRELLADPLTLTTRGRTRDAIHLDAAVRAKYEAKYAGTRIGRQELEGEILDDVEGALWTWDNIDRGRVDAERRPELVKVAVAMDPSVSVTEDSDLCGIIACGLGVDRCGYVLEDRSARVAGSPAARRAWLLWRDVHANDMVYEENQGMAWVAEILRRVWYEMQAEGILPAGAPPLRPKRATLGKRLRAEPIAALWEMTIPRARMVGSFVELEEQMTTWVPDEEPKSPDRVDALVHCLAHLMGNDVPAGVGHVTDVPMSMITGRRRPRPMPHLARRRR